MGRMSVSRFFFDKLLIIKTGMSAVNEEDDPVCFPLDNLKRPHVFGQLWQIGGVRGIGTAPKEGTFNLKVRSIAPIPEKVVYAVVTMYRIGRDNRGTTLVCRACTHIERIQDFKRSIGNPRTLAAQAMLKHVHAEHSRETHVRAVAMVMERQHAPR